jgi:hypothetical protein
MSYYELSGSVLNNVCLKKGAVRMAKSEVYGLAEKIHALLVQHCANSGSESESTCAPKIAHALWVLSPDVNDREEGPHVGFPQAVS